MKAIFEFKPKIVSKNFFFVISNSTNLFFNLNDLHIVKVTEFFQFVKSMSNFVRVKDLSDSEQIPDHVWKLIADFAVEGEFFFCFEFFECLF